jgi:hypothetical protein
MTTSPLSTPSPDALALIFEGDPLERTEAEVLLAIQELHRRRNAFTSDEAAKSLKPKATRTKAEKQEPQEAAKLDKPPTEISLDDI